LVGPNVLGGASNHTLEKCYMEIFMTKHSAFYNAKWAQVLSIKNDHAFKLRNEKLLSKSTLFHVLHYTLKPLIYSGIFGKITVFKSNNLFVDVSVKIYQQRQRTPRVRVNQRKDVYATI
jgi:hypothetical protein